MFLSVIVSTYNNPDWLEKAVLGWANQSHREFELVIADDGSGPETRARIDALRDSTGLSIRHVWQEDDGFQKTRILNKSIRESAGEYLVFSDGDCIPQPDFLATHVAESAPGRFLSGGYFKLPMAASKAITADDIRSGRAFDVRWLQSHGEKLPNFFKRLKLTASGTTAGFLNAMTRTKPTWNGHNASGWTRDIVAVNGFDERMQYGGEDWEMGLRLVNHGIVPKQIRYSTVCVHLDHPRGYETPESHARNAAIGKETIDSGKDWTPFGLVKSDSRPA